MYYEESYIMHRNKPGSVYTRILTEKNHGKNILSGKITDEKTGAALAGTSIYIPDLKVGVRANEDGSYSTPSLPAGKYLVEVSFVGFETIFETIDLTGTIQKNFALKETALEQEGVTVTGVSSATRIKQSPQPVSVMKRADLIGISSTNIINTLVHIPGVNSRNNRSCHFKALYTGSWI